MDSTYLIDEKKPLIEQLNLTNKRLEQKIKNISKTDLASIYNIFNLKRQHGPIIITRLLSCFVILKTVDLFSLRLTSTKIERFRQDMEQFTGISYKQIMDKFIIFERLNIS